MDKFNKIYEEIMESTDTTEIDEAVVANIDDLLSSKIEIINSGNREEKKAIYKGYRIIITPEIEEDNIKWFHHVIAPNSKKEKIADINPYDSTFSTVALWIECGIPKRTGIGPLRKEDLVKMIKDKRK